MSRKLIVDIVISADEYIKAYAGTAKVVVTRARDGRRVRFPANILRPFVTRSGIQGAFVIEFDDTNRFKGVYRL